MILSLHRASWLLGISLNKLGIANLLKNLTDSWLWVGITFPSSAIKEVLLSPYPRILQNPKPGTTWCLIMLMQTCTQDFSISSKFMSPNSLRLHQSFMWTLWLTILFNGYLIQRPAFACCQLYHSFSHLGNYLFLTMSLRLNLLLWAGYLIKISFCCCCLCWILRHSSSECVGILNNCSCYKNIKFSKKIKNS